MKPRLINSLSKQVYIFNGDLHLIPLPEDSANGAKLPLYSQSVSEAVSCVRNVATDTRASQAVQDVLRRRLTR